MSGFQNIDAIVSGIVSLCNGRPENRHAMTWREGKVEKKERKEKMKRNLKGKERKE